MKKWARLFVASFGILSLQSCTALRDMQVINVPTGKWGLINRTGDFVVEPKYDNIGDQFWSSIGVVKPGDPIAVPVAGKWGYIDRKGNRLGQTQFTDTYSFGDGLARVWDLKDKTVYIDQDAKPAFSGPPDSLDADCALFSEGLGGAVGPNHLMGYIDKSGKFVIEPKWKHVEPFSEGLAAVIDESGATEFIDKQGKVAITFPKDGIERTVIGPFHSGAAILALHKGESKTPAGFELVQKSGKLIPFPENIAFATAADDLPGTGMFPTDGMIPVCVADVPKESAPMGYMNTDGKVVIPPQFADLGPFVAGLAPAKSKDGSWGYIDMKGNWVIKPQFAYAKPFSEGLAAVRDLASGKYGYINDKGQIVVKPMYQQAGPFHQGESAVWVATDDLPKKHIASADN